METLVINIKNKEDSERIKEFLSHLDVEVDKASLRQQLPKSKIKSAEALIAMGGTMKGQLISKEHLRSISWKKRNW